MDGNIANKIEAKDKKLSEILTNGRYEIEYFQREYRWARRHVEDLISDLSGSFFINHEDGHDVEDESKYNRYYLGPIVILEKPSSELSIVDGQQRLTSLTLLIIYLNHLQTEILEDEDEHKNLRLYLYYKKGKKETLVLDVDKRVDVINHLFNNSFDPYENETDDESVQNILDRYSDIKLLFPEEIKEPSVLPVFIEWFMEKVVLVEIKAFSSQNAYSIFETMNDRGLNLTPTEMLKSYLLAKAEEDEKIRDLNDLWRDRIVALRAKFGDEADQDFFKAWLRSKYAEKIRKAKSGSENEDFENIGTRFHTWVRENEKRIELTNSEDFYFFVKSDFDFYSSVYMLISDLQSECHEKAENVYISSFYKIADSLSYPLYMAAITKLDDEEEQLKKINLVSWFIDNYTTSRTILGKSITQSSIRNAMYELIKSIRNKDLDELKVELLSELQKNVTSSEELFPTFQRMDNWSYYHYFFARILYYFNTSLKLEFLNFPELLRSKRQRSLVLYRFVLEGEIEEGVEPQLWEHYINSVACFCLVRRFDIEILDELNLVDRIKWLIEHKCMPELDNYNLSKIKKGHLTEFLLDRSTALEEIVPKIWRF